MWDALLELLDKLGVGTLVGVLLGWLLNARWERRTRFDTVRRETYSRFLSVTRKAYRQLLSVTSDSRKSQDQRQGPQRG